MSVVVGCDVGTQGTKAVAIAADGAVVARSTAHHAVDVPGPGRAEQDPTGWSDAVRTCLAAIADQLGPRAADVTHIGVDAQVDGVVAASPGLRPLGPALIWMDRRATAEVRSLVERVTEESLFAITGLNADSSHGAPKMMWLLSNLDEQPRWLLPPASFIVAALTGEVVQDHANASSSMLYDVASRTWSPKLLEAAGIAPEMLPPTADATALAGAVTREVSEATGIPRGCVVTVGTGDDHAAATGVGATVPGIVADITGTAEPIGTSSTAPVFDDERLLESHAHAVPGTWFIENPGFVSGGSTLWLAELLGITQADVFVEAARAPAGCRGLVFIPALSGSVAPRWNDHARASFTGASMDHGTGDFCRAVLEGCAFALRDNIDRLSQMGLPVDEIRVTGGGARVGLWLQIKADVTGRPLRPVAGEAAAAGAAYLAAVGAGWFDDVTEAVDALGPRLGSVVEPDPSRRSLYDTAYGAYRATFDALEPTFGDR